MLHDLFDAISCNPHTAKNPHERFRNYINETDDVRKEVKNVGKLLESIARPFCTTVIVNSNHDDMFSRFLARADYREDHKNAIFFLESQLRMYKAIEANTPNYNPFYDALLNEYDKKIIQTVKFLNVDESYKIKDIECGMHGDRGAGGRRGYLAQFARSQTKTITGHSHVAGIIRGAYSVGTFSKLRLNYNKGMSAWTSTLAVIFHNGKRMLLTRNKKGFLP